jgi:molybdopterin-containing oxidoreductase family iron-sulfur binding subunit
LPLSHALESWSDIRAFDGTASIIQPLIRPLYDSRAAQYVLGLLQGNVSTDPYQSVRETWRGRASGNFDDWWRQALHAGLISATENKPAETAAPKLPEIAPAEQAGGLTLTISPDPSIWDGCFSSNAWMQECAKPVTSEVWGNALHISPKDARERGLGEGDVVHLSSGDVTINAPVLVQAGQADGVITATLGYGRTKAGPIGTGVGFDAYRLQKADALWAVENVQLTATGKRKEILRTQHHHTLAGEAKELFPTLEISELSHAELRDSVHGEDLPTLQPFHQYDRYKWGMVIDTSACIGCNACVIACQSENNVPVVGPAEISMGRDMHWLRIDTYFSADAKNKAPGFQPVPCMHCEHAPCEPVCPVEASVHDSEGLNVQVYNRCIGTRFCQSNCPYKVRRFNFFEYSFGQAYANQGQEVVKAHFNPDVTVRARGVMEKCTYCVQRISRARRESERSDTPIPDDAVVTACQAACPTRAITFGDLNNKNANLNKLRHQRHHYALLRHLGTRPRTTYLARLRNPNPQLKDEDS